MTILSRTLARAGGTWGRRAKRHRSTRFMPLPGLEPLEDRQLLATSMATFESFGLAPGAFVNNAGPTGAFVDAGNAFNNEFSPDFGGIWSGWAISSMTDTTNPDFSNQYSAITGSGADGSPTYGVAFTSSGSVDPFHPDDSFVNLPEGATPVSIDITNTTYAYLTMRDGSLFTSPFAAGDYFRLTIEGYTGPEGTGTKVGEVDFDLANYLGTNHYIVNTWQTMDLSSLAGAGSLRFGLESSQNNPLYGMNTPAYFAVDNLTLSTPSGTVGGVVFNDLDGNGSQDGNEGGLQGWVVELYSGTTLIATAGPTGSDGHYSIPDVAPGTYTLRQVPKAGFSQTLPVAQGVYEVTITDGANLSGFNFGNAPLTLTSIVVTPANPSLAKGLSQQFIATGTYSDHSTQDLTAQVVWASATPAITGITAGGLATGEALGTSTITATLGSVSGSTALTVTEPVVVSIAVTPANPSLAKGLGQQFTAIGTYSDQTTQDLTSLVSWTSATPSIAGISAGGLATGAALGTSTITATLGDLSDSSVLTVTAPVLVSISVAPVNPSLAKGLSQQFTATGTYSDQSTQDLTGQVVWASATPTTVVITTGGLASGEALGTSTITATLDGMSGSSALTVTPPVVVSIAVTPVNPGLAKGLTQQFTAIGTYSDQTTQDLTSLVSWTSATPSIAGISTGGLASGAALGTSTITAALGSVSGSTDLTVTAPVVLSIAVAPENPSLAKGLAQQFRATGIYSDQSTQDLTGQVVWASATPTTATITTGGLATGEALGTSTITATLGDVSGSTVLTVTAPVVLSIAVSPVSPSLAKGLGQQFTALGTYSDQTTQDLTSLVSWSSSNLLTAAITAGGLATGEALGTSMITATLGDVSGSSVLTVTAARLVSIVIDPRDPRVEVGQAGQLTAVGVYTDGSTSNVTGQVAWVSADNAVATISNSGLASGLAAGSTTVTAALDGVTGTSSMLVTPTSTLPTNPETPETPTDPETPTPPETSPTSPVTLTSLRVERVRIVGRPRLRNVKALVAGFSGALSEAAVRDLNAYAVIPGRVLRSVKGSQVAFSGRVTLARAIYDAPRNQVILIPARPAQLSRIDRLWVDVSRLTDSQNRPINNGWNFEAVATPRGLLEPPVARQSALSAAAVDAYFQ